MPVPLDSPTLKMETEAERSARMLTLLDSVRVACAVSPRGLLVNRTQHA